MKTIIGITGTTAVGKSAAAVKLAKMLGTEIISCDSMQVYKGMNIGTSKITPEETEGVKHHMLDVVEPSFSYSAFAYASDVAKIVESMQKPPIMVGGTGFYFDCLVKPPEFGECEPEVKLQVKEFYQNEGLAGLQEWLKKLDAESYGAIDANNPKRVMRAIEIALCGGSRVKGNNCAQPPKYDLKLLVLQRNRSILYEQIERRVDKMVEEGLLDEVAELYERYDVGNHDYSAFEAIGYKELIAHLQGKCSLQEAIEQIKINTRHYAKRQIAYFKRMNVTEFVDVDEMTPQDIANHISDVLRSESSARGDV